MRQSTRRVLAYGSNATLVTLIAFAALAMLYALADANRARLDLSEGASNTLQPDTIAKLQLLDADGQTVEIVAFTAQGSRDDADLRDRMTRDLLKEIDHRSDAVTWQLLDFDRERLTAERLGVTEHGRIVVMRGDNRVDIKERSLFRYAGKGDQRQLQFTGEEALSRAFSQLMTDQRQVVYVLRGHGELSAEDGTPAGLTDLAGRLDRERYDVKPLDLRATTREGEAPRVPDDAAVVFVARPKAPLAPQEEDILLSYLGRGGSLLFAVDVGLPVPALLGRLGVTVPEGVVADKEVYFPYTDRPRLQPRAHETTQELADDDLDLVLSHPAPVGVPDPPPEGLRYAPLVMTSRQGWIERGGPLVDGLPSYDPQLDGPGPASAAVAVQVLPGAGLVRSSKQAARVAVVGDGEMFTNALLAEGPGNAVFATNLFHWLAGQDQRLQTKVARVSEVRRLAITEQERDRIRWLSLGLMPALVALLGAGTWYTRRGR